MTNMIRFFGQFLAYFFIHQMALAVFRFSAAIGSTPVIASTFGRCACLLMFVLGGFLISKGVYFVSVTALCLCPISDILLY